MENIKQVIYRHEDTALMIIPSDEEIQIVPRFVNELSEEDKASFLLLKDFCLTLVEDIQYIVYTNDVDRLDIQPSSGTVVCLTVNELEEADKLVVETVLSKCEELLKNN
jgi:predicted lactoylglutathione lyase